jgi:hypothetical protein
MKKLEIKDKHIKKAIENRAKPDFIPSGYCIVVEALKDVFPKAKRVYCGTSTANVDDVLYRLSPNLERITCLDASMFETVRPCVGKLLAPR